MILFFLFLVVNLFSMVEKVDFHQDFNLFKKDLIFFLQDEVDCINKRNSIILQKFKNETLQKFKNENKFIYNEIFNLKDDFDFYKKEYMQRVIDLLNKNNDSCVLKEINTIEKLNIEKENFFNFIELIHDGFLIKIDIENFKVKNLLNKSYLIQKPMYDQIISEGYAEFFDIIQKYKKLSEYCVCLEEENFQASEEYCHDINIQNILNNDECKKYYKELKLIFEDGFANKKLILISKFQALVLKIQKILDNRRIKSYQERQFYYCQNRKDEFSKMKSLEIFLLGLSTMFVSNNQILYFFSQIKIAELDEDTLSDGVLDSIKKFIIFFDEVVKNQPLKEKIVEQSRNYDKYQKVINQKIKEQDKQLATIDLKTFEKKLEIAEKRLKKSQEDSKEFFMIIGITSLLAFIVIYNIESLESLSMLKGKSILAPITSKKEMLYKVFFI